MSSDANNQAIDLAAIRRRLSSASGPEYWRSLEEIARTPEFEAFLHREFPEAASEWTDPVSRRSFLRLMSASLALAGIAACTRQPVEKIVPYVKAPEDIVLGKPLFYATAVPHAGYGIGVLVESHEGRPTKIEGNPHHPGSLGATDAFTQANLLSLYDPDRAQTIMRAGRISTWGTFLGELGEAIGAAPKGAGLRILTGTVTSPTLAGQLRALTKTLPEARWHQYESINDDNILAGSRMVFGDVVDARYRFADADVVLSLDDDFMGTGPGMVRYARDFASRRRMTGGQKEMNRLYCAETTPSVTGSIADHRLPVRPSEIAQLAGAIMRVIGLSVEAKEAPLSTPLAEWAEAVAADLKAHSGRTIVTAGRSQPPTVHAMVHEMNAALGNVGHTVAYTEPVRAEPTEQIASLRGLVEDMNTGRVSLLIMLGGNPVYAAPADIGFGEALERVKMRVHLSSELNETAALCHWHIPESHNLESWGDIRAFDGTVSVVQPLIAPLYTSKSAGELVAAMTGRPDASNYELVREYWKGRHQGSDFEVFWRTSLNNGVIPDTAAPVRQVSLRGAAASQPATAKGTDSSAGGAELTFAPDPSVWDGRYANNGWLQELPRPLSKLTWDNAIIVSPATAQRLGLAGGDVVELECGGRTVRGGAWILPGQAAEAVTLHLGYGRERSGKVGTGVGFNAGALRTSTAFWSAGPVQIRRLGEKHGFACTQHHHSLEGRNIVRAATLEEYRKEPGFAARMGEAPKPEQTMFPDYKDDGYSWGMAINQNACIGCNACMVACQAENNVPVVGKEQVTRGRVMHWLRIDRYYKGDIDNPQTFWQPMLCQHCEKAPCEVVCPVAATVHSAEGLNQMVYNRCVGTRYCANNCPYKVRRFNFLLFKDFETESLRPMRNPNVTVRSRGVMEKCTYCVQRINAARITAEKEDRTIRDSEVATACEAACPTQAIVFGNVNDPNSLVSRLKRDPLNYGVLEEQNTRPRTTYLAKVTNPNPALPDPDSKKDKV